MEALAIIFVFVVAVGAYAGARLAGSHQTAQSRAESRAQLEQYREVLRTKARQGQRDGWDSVMMNRIADQLEKVEQRLGRDRG